MKSAVIITAAGSGSRMGVEKNKILLPLNNKTVIEQVVSTFIQSNQFCNIIIHGYKTNETN